MNLLLRGKEAIATGASAGVGLSTARILADEGVRVTIPGRSLSKLQDVVKTLPGKVTAIEADATTLEGVKRLVEQVPATDPTKCSPAATRPIAPTDTP